MPYNALAYPYQLNEKELPSNQTAAAAYLALPYASSSGAWGGPTVSTTVWAQSPYYLPNWGDESQAPGSAAAQAVSPVATASVTRPDAVLDARDVSANTALNKELANQTTIQTNAGTAITNLNNLISASPTVMSINPSTAVHDAGTAVTIIGSGFSVSTPTVNVGGACTSVVVVNDGELTCNLPTTGASAGATNVSVTTTKGTGTLTGGMTYT
jgi:IPT/TIG domain